jgi:uncharacterized membrane protein YsdA (DUF1294 family)
MTNATTTLTLTVFAMMGSDREALQSLTRRVERIEHRLELTETH